MSASTEKILLVGAGAEAALPVGHAALNRFSFPSVRTGADAIAKLESNCKIAVVIADLLLPGLSGLELLSRLRERWPALRRVLIAGEADRDLANAALVDGRLSYMLTPPLGPQPLAELLCHAVEEYRFAAALEPKPRGLDLTSRAGERTPQYLLAMMHHELRTPLNHILGFSALLEQRCKQRGDTEPLEYLAYIRQSGATLLRNVNRILEIARLTSEDFAPEPEVFDLAGLARDEAERQRSCASARGITIGVDAPSEPLWALANEADIGMAVGELLDNAVKFNHPGGHVAVALRDGHGEVALRVADTGTGMAGADINRVLQAFRRGEARRADHFDGAGVGLTLASLTAQVYGGTLNIESRKNHGTAVVLRLKRAAAARQAARIA